MRIVKAHALRARLRTAFIQAAFLTVIAVVCAVAFNSYRQGGIAWFGSWPLQEAEVGARKAVRNVSIDDAWRKYREGKVLFVDARTPSEFLPAHLPGAVNVPADRVEKSLDALMRAAASGRELIVYCSGPDCRISSELATVLTDKGIPGVSVLPEGWSGWLDSGFPIEESGRD